MNDEIPLREEALDLLKEVLAGDYITPFDVDGGETYKDLTDLIMHIEKRHITIKSWYSVNYAFNIFKRAVGKIEPTDDKVQALRSKLNDFIDKLYLEKGNKERRAQKR